MNKGSVRICSVLRILSQPHHFKHFPHCQEWKIPRVLQLCIPLNQSGSIQVQKEKIISTTFSECFFRNIWTPGLWTTLYLPWNIRCNLQLVADTELLFIVCQFTRVLHWINIYIEFLHAIESNPLYSVEENLLSFFRDLVRALNLWTRCWEFSYHHILHFSSGCFFPQLFVDKIDSIFTWIFHLKDLLQSAAPSGLLLQAHYPESHCWGLKDWVPNV